MSERPFGVAASARLGDGVELDDDVTVGHNVVIHGPARIGAGSVIREGSVLGRIPDLGQGSSAPRWWPERPLRLGRDVLVGVNSILFAAVHLCEGVAVGDLAMLREGVDVGREAMIGGSVAVGRLVSVGDRSRVQNNSMIAAGSIIESEVFIGPSVVTTNDPTMGRRAAGQSWSGVLFRARARVGAGAVLLPGVEVGEEAVVGAGSLVTRDVPPRTLVLGSPARMVRELEP
jgi:UDP-2-acetamido-3-amino-2,3-dideoxy-glucuronate N-acetyltransferase